jgi:hypothetical protein
VNVGLANLNVTALDLIQQYGFNLTALGANMSASVSGLTPASFSSTFGNTATRTSKLQSFNTLAQSINGSFPGWNVTYIVNAYIVNPAQFKVRHCF